ncbi:uncharacterized protein [Mytilus edulis]|uniref:uncharacterized protein n=1 Tax=Mytilus edulis TaxID=6550 RepID=UPI0039F05D06
MAGTDKYEWSNILLEYLPSGVIFEICKHLTWQDIFHISQTCRRFNQLCDKATIWLQLKSLDFSKCMFPLDLKVLDVVKRCPQIEFLKLTNVVSSENARKFREEETTPADRFLLEVLRHCPSLYTMDLSMVELTDNSVNAICTKCEQLRSFTLTDNDFISNEGIVNLLSYLPLLSQLHIIRCTNVIPMIKHKDEGKVLALKDIRIESCELFKANVSTLLKSCVQLEHLCLIDNVVLQGFPNSIPNTEKSGMNTLKTLKLYSQPDMREVNFEKMEQLESLKVKQCPHLLHINMWAPKLHCFQIAKCENLKSVNFYDVRLTEINLSGCENLAEIGVDSPVLKSIDISDCKSLTAHQFLIGINIKSCVDYINMSGCNKMNSAEIDNIIQEFPSLNSFVFGGDHLTNAEINSVDLTTICFKANKIMSCLALNIPTLKTLTCDKCSGLTEQHLMDGLLFGEKKNHGVQGLETLIRDIGDYTPFKGRVGVPGLETLVLQHVPGIQGHLLSDSLSYFKNLTDVQLKNCACLKELHFRNLKQLSTLTIESCNHLSTVKVHSMSNLKIMTLKWCSMINYFNVVDVNLLKLDVTGCNFAHFTLLSATLSDLSLSGVCTQPSHTMSLKCPKMTELAINKCNSLDDVTLHRLFTDNPNITSLTLSVSDHIRCISVPSGVTSFSITALKRLQAITMEKPIKIQHLKLNNLIKFTPSSRVDILKTCSSTLTKLEVRAIPKEQALCLELPKLESLTLDQGIDLVELEIFCPKLLYLRIQGCPRLNHMLLQLNKLSQLQVNHSSPLLALKTMVLHVIQVQHVANVLAHYSPNLTTLEFKGSYVTKEYLCELGRAIDNLTVVNLSSCNLGQDLEDCNSSLVLDGSECGRSLSLTVNIHNDMDVG